MERPPSQPIAVTPPQSAPPAPQAAPLPPPAPVDLSNRPVIATTRPPAAAPVQPVATWPELKITSAAPAPPPAAPAPAIRGAALALEKVGPPGIEPGKPFTYEIIVRNVGSAAAQQVCIDAPLPEGGRYLGGEPMAEAVEDGLTWKLGTLDAGAERRLRVEVQTDGNVDLNAYGAVVAFSTS